MAKITFETLSFEEKEDKVVVKFLRIFYFELPKDSLSAIGEFKTGKNSVEFRGVKKPDAESKLNILLAKGFANLRNMINNKQAIYVHKLSGIPLIGNIAFGIIDRNTNIIEIKPVTVCNLKCVYCSVNDDLRPVDFVVEKDYIIEEFKKIINYKKCSNIEAHIGGQAEPLYYADLIPLVKDLSSIKQVKTISIDTNGTLLAKKNVDELVKAGMTRFNLSINAMEQEIAEKIAGMPYNLKKVLGIAAYISKKADLIIAPVWVPGINDKEMPKLIKFTRLLQEKSKNKVTIGIQNFLNYRYGRNPVKQMSWQLFEKKMRQLEKKHNIKLLLDFKKDFNIEQTKPLPKPFRKGQKIDAAIVCPGRLAGEKIAVAENRSITVPKCVRTGSVKLKITRTKHNIYYGVCL